MANLHWSHYHAFWPHLAAPLRPPRATADKMCALLPTRQGKTILLGVTPELANATSSLVAVDCAPEMIRAIWPGDTAQRRAVCADWLDLPFVDRSFLAAIGDGCSVVLTFPDQHERLYASLSKALAPGARIVLRTYCRPDTGESAEQVRWDATEGHIGGFQAFKWRLAMALVSERKNANLPVRDLLATFDAMFPDRAALIAKTGWVREQVDTISGYATSHDVYSFPTRSQLLSALPSCFTRAHFVETDGYPLAERCPILVADLVA